LERHYFNYSAMALLFERTPRYAPILLDTANIVREAIFHQLRGKGAADVQTQPDETLAPGS